MHKLIPVFPFTKPVFLFASSCFFKTDSFSPLFLGFHRFPDLLSCAERHGILEQSAQKQQHHIVSHCSRSSIEQSAVLCVK